MAREQDILKLPAPKRPPRLTSRRIGIHTSIAGGVENAAERAYRLGCNTFQVFSSSPRQWQPYDLSRPQCDQMNRLREKYGLRPLVIHTNYLINLASTTEQFLAKSVEAFRGELERALSLCAEYLVLHPGSFRGASRDEGLARVAASIAVASRGLDVVKGGLTILIENTAGAEYSLGGSRPARAAARHGADRCLHGYLPRSCFRLRHREPGWNEKDSGSFGLHRRVQECSRVALQRCQGRTRIEARPSPAHRKGKHRAGAVPAIVERSAVCSCRLHRGNSHRRSRRRQEKCRGAEGSSERQTTYVAILRVCDFFFFSHGLPLKTSSLPARKNRLHPKKSQTLSGADRFASRSGCESKDLVPVTHTPPE